MKARVALFLLLFSLLVLGAAPPPGVTPGPGVTPPETIRPVVPVPSGICPPSEGGCPGCQELKDASQSNINLVMDEAAHTLTANVYYENLTAPPPTRKVINFSTVIVQVYNESFSETYRIFTDAEGNALFDFSQYADSCVRFKFLYCPFTCTDSSACGFQQCLNFSGIGCPPCVATDIPWFQEKEPPMDLECYRVLPAYDEAGYCPPPKPMNVTPALCLPLILIFALLGGALFLSGKNPFAGFDFSAPRIGKHITYQARARGFSLDLLSVFKQVQAGRAADKQQRIKDLITLGKSDAEIAKITGYDMNSIQGVREGMKAAVTDQKTGGKVTTALSKSAERGTKAKIAAEKARMKTAPEYRGVAGYFRGLGKAFALVGSKFIASSVFGAFLPNKALAWLDKLANVFPNERAQAIATRSEIIKKLDEAGVQISEAAGKGPISIEMNGKSCQIEVASFNPDSVKPGSSGLEATFKLTTPEGTMFVECKGENVFATDQLGVKYNVTNGAYQPVSMDIGGGKEIKFADLGGGNYGFTTDAGSFKISFEKGVPAITDLKTGEMVPSPTSTFGIDPTIAFSHRNEPAPISFNDNSNFSAAISQNQSPAYTFTKGDLPDRFGGGKPVDVREVNPAATEPNEVARTLTNSQGITYLFNKDDKTLGAEYADGKPVYVDDKGYIQGTKEALGFSKLGNQYEQAKELHEAYRANDAGYKQIVKETSLQNVGTSKEWSDQHQVFLKRLYEDDPLKDPAEYAKNADTRDRVLYLIGTEGLARPGTTLGNVYELAAKKKYKLADLEMEKFFKEKNEAGVKPK